MEHKYEEDEEIGSAGTKPESGKKEFQTGSKKDDRLRPLFLFSLLLRHTDAEHPLSTKDLQALMQSEYGVSMHRTTVASNIEILRAAGFEIFSRRSRTTLYYLEGRQFELPELKILIDAVESSRFITEKKCRELEKKLMSLTSTKSAPKLKRNIHTSGRVRSGNEKGYYIVDAINEAINDGRQLSFYYTDYDGQKKEILRNDGRPYIVSPYMLIWNGDFYYLVAYNHEKDTINNFRVDRIRRQPEILAAAARPVPAGFDAARYTKEVFRMYDTEETIPVTLHCRNDVMKGIIDQFGMDVPTRKVDEGHFLADVNVCTSPTFFGWVFQWEGRVRIIAPESVRDAYRRMCRKNLE